jgi:SAM-dependent methyltransferase
LGFQCWGVDRCPYETSVSKDIPVHYLDIAKDPLPFEDEFFNIVYHKSLIEHLYSPDHLMKETNRVLKAGGGRVIILTPDWVSQMDVFYEDFTHSRPYDTTSVNDLLNVYGFTAVESQLFYQLPILWKHPSIQIICKILQALLSTPRARKLSKMTNVKFFRWAVELMVLGTGIKA